MKFDEINANKKLQNMALNERNASTQLFSPVN